MSQLSQGLKQKELGLALTTMANRDFVETGRGIARLLCKEHGRTCMSKVREKLDERGYQPKSRNAYGAIFHSEEFECVGFTISTHASRRGGVERVWKLRSEAIV